MSEFNKKINTRIGLKIDTLENWGKSTIGLLRGEIAIATVAAESGTGLSEPVCMIKIGEDGIKTFSQLDWNFYAKASDVISACKSTEDLTAFVNNLITNASLASSADMEVLAARVTTAEGKITTLNGDETTEGSVAKAIADAIAALKLDETYVAIEDGKSLVDDLEITKLSGVSEGANKVEASTNGNIKIDGDDTVVYTHPEEHSISEITDLQDSLDDKVDKEEGKGLSTNDLTDELKGNYDDAYAHSLEDHAPADAEKNIITTVKVNGTALTVDSDRAVDVVIPAQTDYSVTVTEDTSDSTIAKRYIFSQLGNEIGRIDLAKELVVTSGSVGEVSEADAPYSGAVVGDKYIELVIANQEEHIFIPAKDLVDIYTPAAGATEVQVAISGTNEISATLVDGGVAKAKLATDVQESLGKADSAVQPADLTDLNTKAHTHDNKDLLDTYTQTEEDLADAVTKKHAHENATVLDGISADQVSAWDNAAQVAVDNAEAIDAINDAETGILAQANANAANQDVVVLSEAQKYADGLAGNYATAEQGEKADTALQEVIANDVYTDGSLEKHSGLKVTDNNKIEIDDTITWIFDCGDAEVSE